MENPFVIESMADHLTLYGSALVFLGILAGVIGPKIHSLELMRILATLHLGFIHSLNLKHLNVPVSTPSCCLA